MRKLTKSTIISNQKEYSHDENVQINISSSKRPRVSMNQRNLHDRLSESSSDGSMQSFFRIPLANITNANTNLHLRNITHIDGVPIKEWLGKNHVPVFNHDQYRSVAHKDPYYTNYSGSNGMQTGQDENELRKMDDCPTTTTTQSNVILVGSHTTNTKTLHSNISGSSAAANPTMPLRNITHIADIPIKKWLQKNLVPVFNDDQYRPVAQSVHSNVFSEKSYATSTSNCLQTKDVYPTNEPHCEDVS
ncbi:hypothetical protein OROHE_018890 [Orobanche hederae]